MWFNHQPAIPLRTHLDPIVWVPPNLPNLPPILTPWDRVPFSLSAGWLGKLIKLPIEVGSF
jgi:hypothetical protein